MSMSVDQFIFHLVNCNEEAAVRQALAKSPELARGADATLGTTALHCASHRGFVGIVAALLEAGADVHASERVSDSTPLHWAAEGGHPAVARMLLERGAALDPVDSWWGLAPVGWTTVVVWAPPFHEDRPATLALMLGAGGKLDIFTAVVLGDQAAVRAIAAADPAQLARRMGFAASGVQPLHLAISRGLTGMVRLLLELGADVHAATASGLTPLAVSLGSPDAAIQWALRQHGAAEDLSTAVVLGDGAAAQRFLADASSGERLNPLLSFAAQLDREGMIELLVAHGADPNARSKQLIREVPTLAAPLHLAAMHGRAGTVRALLKSGADANAGVADGIPTPLHLAAGEGHVETVRALVAGGADTAATERWFGATPAGWAQHGNHRDVVAVLEARPR